MSRPWVLLSFATTLDGFLDDSSPDRLIISDAADLARVDAERAGCDAILVGAGTVRADDPRLLVRDPALRAARLARGERASPLRVTLSRSGRLSSSAKLFTTPDAGAGPALVYAANLDSCVGLGAGAEVVELPGELRLPQVVADLGSRGVRRLMIEGGAEILENALVEGLVDEVHWARAPWSLSDRSLGDRPLGDRAAPRVGPMLAELSRRSRAVEVRSCGGMTVWRYSVAACVGAGVNFPG